jgi:hypothetical protein
MRLISINLRSMLMSFQKTPRTTAKAKEHTADVVPIPTDEIHYVLSLFVCLSSPSSAPNY